MILQLSVIYIYITYFYFYITFSHIKLCNILGSRYIFQARWLTPPPKKDWLINLWV